MIMMYGTLFMMAGAYTLAQDRATSAATCCTASSGRARRRRSTSILYILFFIPGVFALT